MIALWTLLAWPALAQPIAWEIAPSTSAVLLGSPVSVTGTLRAEGARDWVLDAAASTTDYFAIGEAAYEPAPAEAGRSVKRFSFQVVPLQTGRIAVTTLWKAAGAGSTETLQSPPFPLDVGEPALDPQGKPRDIKEPRPARPALWPWLLLAAAALGAYAAYRRLRRAPAGAASPAPPADNRPAEVVAEADFAALEASGLWAAGRHKEFYIGLTDILRRYLERRYGIPATRLTTAELVRHLRHAEVDRGVFTAVKAIFDRADLVKFAKTVPGQDWGPRDLGGGRGVVRETTPRDLAAPGVSA